MHQKTEKELDKIKSRADAYFNRSREIILKNGDCNVTYAVFMRRPVICAPKLALDALKKHVKNIKIIERFKEGDMVGAGEVIFYYSGKFSDLVHMETRILQLLGSTCVAAYNAYSCASSLPNVEFIAMDGRHCAGYEMMEMMAYGASIGSKKAKLDNDACGFIGTSHDASSHYFNSDKGLGTMPHALIGYAGSTLKAAKIYHNLFESDKMTVLVDYFGKEVSDSIEVAKEFSEMAQEGRLSFRIDTSSGRFVEGLDAGKSYKILDQFSPKAIRSYRTETELKAMVGAGVSAASIWHLRSQLDNAGFNKVRIVASSGFTPEKCRAFALTNAPVNVIGTGSYIPENWIETYATADIISYDGQPMVKIGREFLQSQYDATKTT